MPDFVLKRGDTAPTLVAVLRDKDNLPVTLTGAAVLFVMRLATAATNTAPAVQSTMVIDPDQTANKGQVSYQWIANDTKSAGVYSAEFVVTWPDGREQTFPTQGFVSVQINDDLESHLSSLRAAPAFQQATYQLQESTTALETLIEAEVPVKRALVLTSDADAKTTIARKTSASTAPTLTDAELTQLVALAKRPEGGYNTNRAAAEGWRWKAGKCTGNFTFSADGVQVDKSMLMAHCLEMAKAFTKGQVRTVGLTSEVTLYEGR